ncbi:hypothetical protein [Micromonospora sp. KLBMP9576]|uniref:hypothetical protein n=1 Tax=Micromonospora sp. KLBMP9576 TaxID=3424769 RepID=UPI003D93D6A7
MRIFTARRRWSAAAVALLTVVTGAVVNPAPASAAAVNKNPKFIQVYVNNVENLLSPGERCAGDWRNLIKYMKSQPYSPDLFLVQQINPRGELPRLLDHMNKQLAGGFKAVVAVPSPVKHVPDNDCGQEKAYQTNVIIYRVGRFELKGAKSVWQSRRPGSCGAPAELSRSINVAQRLRDKVTGKDVAVASIHWPWHGRGTSPTSCPQQNADLTASKMKAFTGAKLYIAGGDFNQRDRDGEGFRGWHKKMRNVHGYADAAVERCAGEPGTTLNCTLKHHWTHGGGESRIDYLFAKRPAGKAPMSAEHTISYNEAGKQRYSTHRAIRARIHY